MIMKLFMSSIACLLTASSLAAPAQPPARHTASKGTMKTITNYCPKAEALKKKKQRWYAQGGWKSYSDSFVPTITSFTGAQWVGVRVGKIICLYAGKIKMTFPVTLEQTYHTTVSKPSGHNWGRNLGGYANCYATKVKDCPFLIKIHVHPTMKSIYKDLEKMKQQKTPSTP